MKKTITAATLCVPFLAQGAYFVTGPVKAETCYSFGVTMCSYTDVHAVREDGQITDFPEGFLRVSDYSEKTQTCSLLIGRNSGIQLLTRTPSGEYEDISRPDRVKFSCERQ